MVRRNEEGQRGREKERRKGERGAKEGGLGKVGVQGGKGRGMGEIDLGEKKRAVKVKGGEEREGWSGEIRGKEDEGKGGGVHKTR